MEEPRERGLKASFELLLTKADGELENASSTLSTIQVEQRMTSKAIAACDADPKSCVDDCGHDDMASCLAAAMAAWQASPPRFADAKRDAAKACKAGFLLACRPARRIEREASVEDSRLDVAWRAVEVAADRITTTRLDAVFARSHLEQTRQNVRAEARMDAAIPEMLAEDYCPARQDFLAMSSEKEFRRRAREHCTSFPPSHSGPGGEEIPATMAQCMASFSTACANSPGGRRR